MSRRGASRALRATSALVLVVATLVGISEPAAAAGVTVTPSTGLTEGQTVTVGFTGFTPSKTINIRQCLPAPESGDDCDFLSLQNPVADSTGAGTFQFSVLELPNDALPGPVTCDATTSCVITVSDDLNDFTQPTASAAISFGAGTGSTTTTTTDASGTTTTTTGGTGTTTTTDAGATSTTVEGTTTTRPPKQATSVAAEPTLARILPGLRAFFPELEARLTVLSSGSPLAGRWIKFAAGGSAICFAKTDDEGVAKCRTKAPLRALMGFGYAAKFQGDREYLRSVDFSPLLDITVKGSD